MKKIFFVTILILLIIAFIEPSNSRAYRQPISNDYLAPYCPLKADGSKDTSCMFIPKSECDFFVSKQGNDNNIGSEISPFATIQKGVDSINAGENVCIKGYSDGTKYSGSVIFNNKNGNNNAWITIGGYESDKRVVIQGSNYSNGTVGITDSSYIRIIGIEVTKANNGFTAQQSNNIDFINLKAYDNWNWGIGVPNNDGPSQRIRMEHSEIYDNVKKNVLDPAWNPNDDKDGQGGTGAQFNEVAEGAFRYNILYRNFGEGLDVHKDSNQVIVEDNLFSENSHTAFYVNHSSNILFHRNITICSGEKPSWHDQFNRRDDNLGTAITFRQESGHNSDDAGGNNAAINNIVMGCTVHLVATTQTSERPFQSLLVANNTFIDARRKDGNNEKAARFAQLQNESADYAQSVVFLNNIFKFVDTRASLTSANAVDLNLIFFENNITDGSPGFSEGITEVDNLPFLGQYDHTYFLGDNTKPWELSTTQLTNIKRWAMVTSTSPVINTGSVTIPDIVPENDKSRFENLYLDYLNLDYFGKVRGSNPDVGAHESDGTEPTPIDETVMCVSKDVEFGDEGPINDSLVTYDLRLDWPEGSSGSVKVKDYYSANVEIVNKPSYCIEATEEVLGLSEMREGNIPRVFIVIGLVTTVITLVVNSRLDRRKKINLITGVIASGLGLIVIFEVTEKQLGPDDGEAQVVKFLECNVPSNTESINYEVRIIGEEGDMITNEAIVYEDNEDVDSCYKEFVIELEGSGSTPTPSMTPTPTNTQVPGASATPSPTPTQIQGNICGKSDVNGDGVFTLVDFAQFGLTYGNGQNTCSDNQIDYGACGGRDVDRDGFLKLYDFGGENIGFSQRYFPKSSCVLY